MSGNKYLTPDKISLFETKLDVLTKRLQTSLKSGVFSSEEEFLAEASKAVRDFYKYLNSPFFDPTDIRVGQDASVDDFNEYWNTIIDDLTVIFTELESMGLNVVDNFNEMITNTNRLHSRVKNIQSKLDDYALFVANPDPNILYFKETFSNLTRIDVNSNLLEVKECDIRQEEGILTLPINTNDESLVVPTKPVVINATSNGEAGNNYETGATSNSTISLILDDNPDTWFEYERVVNKTSKDEDGLVFDFTIDIGSVRVLNNIRISPYSFGKRTTFNVDVLEISKDGAIYRDIKEEVNQRGMTSEERSSLFTLGASSGKYSGDGIYSFLPKEARFVHLVLKQQTPYTINTSMGTKYRYAIGLRDVTLRGQTFLPTGEVVSSELEAPREIKAVVLEANQSPDKTSDLEELDYLVSFDDGANWNKVLPSHETDAKALQVNTDDPDSVKTGAPVYKLKTKVRMKRLDDQFLAGRVVFADDVEYVSEIHPAPTSAPFTLTLEGSPVVDTVWVIDPSYGSRGLDSSKLKLISGMGGVSDKSEVPIPFDTIPETMMKEETTVSGYSRFKTKPAPPSTTVNVWVGSERWSHATAPIESYTGGTSKVYVFDSVSGVLRFGNGDNSAFPFGSDGVSMSFNPERLFLSGKKNNHAADLFYPTMFNKNKIIIERYDEEIETLVQVQSGTTKIDLGYSNIVDTSAISTAMTSLGYTTQKVFQNGNSELRVSTDWSIDKKNGMIYLKEPIGNTIDAVLSFTYLPVYILEERDFDFVGDEGFSSRIVVRETGWKTIEVENEQVYAEGAALSYDLGNVSVVPDTLTISVTASGLLALTASNNPFVKEVPFQDGRTEFGKALLYSRERVQSMSPTANVATFDLVENISTDTSHAVAFSNRTIFTTEVSGTPSATGEYAVTRTGANRGRVSVYTEVNINSEDAGYVSYFYDNPTYKSNGLYSVDYQNGRVYMQRALPTYSDWVISSDYQYTNYKAMYRIARPLDTREYSIDYANRDILFNEGEVLSAQNRTRAANDTEYYLVNYGRIRAGSSSLDRIRKYYSPIVRHHVLKVRMTEGH